MTLGASRSRFSPDGAEFVRTARAWAAPFGDVELPADDFVHGDFNGRAAAPPGELEVTLASCLLALLAVQIEHHAEHVNPLLRAATRLLRTS